MRRNSSMPTCGLIKSNRRAASGVPLKEIMEERYPSSRGSDLPQVSKTPNNRYNDKLMLKKVAPVGLPPIDQKHLNLRRGGE